MRKENSKSRVVDTALQENAFDKRLQELVEILDFDLFLNRPVGKLSGGQRRRIGYCPCIIAQTGAFSDFDVLLQGFRSADKAKLIWNVIEKLQKTENMTSIFDHTLCMEAAANTLVML